MYDDIDERYLIYCNIRKNVDIVNVISKYLNIEGGPNHYYSNCPFCKENDNKFFVISNQRVFRCFKCMKAGDVIRFVSEVENISYDKAADICKSYLKEE